MKFKKQNKTNKINQPKKPLANKNKQTDMKPTTWGEIEKLHSTKQVRDWHGRNELCRWRLDDPCGLETEHEKTVCHCEKF